MSAMPPALPQQRRKRVQEIIERLAESTSSQRERYYDELRDHRREALEALTAIFPGAARFDGDFRTLLFEPLGDLSPSLDALRIFDLEGLSVLEQFADSPDLNRRLAVVRTALEFPHARSGKLLAQLALDADDRVATAACHALLEGHHAGGLHTARRLAVENLERSLEPDAWTACLRLEAGNTIRIATQLHGRRLKPHLEPLSLLTWHPRSQLPALLALLENKPLPPLTRIRCLALCHPDPSVSEFALQRLARSRHAALAFAPGASELLRRGVAERFKQAMFDL